MNAEHARNVRRQRAATLKAIDDRPTLAAALRDIPEPLLGCPVHLVLIACPGIGQAAVREILERAKIWPLAPLGELTKFERLAIIEVVERKL